MAPSKPSEPIHNPNTPMPAGYVFVPKGSTYVTANCRKQTRAAGKAVFVVVDPVRKRQTGIRVPRSVFAAVSEAEQSTRAKRVAAVEKKDASSARKFEQAIMRLFPKVPTDVLPGIVKHALVKRSKRVGRVGAMDEDKRVQLAVWAHVRHCRTDYDKLLRSGVPRDEAREQVKEKMDLVMKEWRGAQKGKPKGANNGPGRLARRASLDALAKTRNILSPRKKQFGKTTNKKTKNIKEAAVRIGKNGGRGGPRTTGGGRTARASTSARGNKDDLADFIVLDSDSELMFDDDDAEDSDWSPGEY